MASFLTTRRFNLLGLSDSAPESLTMTFPRGYNPSSAKKSGIITKSSPVELHELGCIELGTPYGNIVHAYNAERTLCDMLRGTASPDLQLLSPAFRSYLSSQEKNLPKLQSYAKALGVCPQSKEVHRGAAMNTRNAMQLKALINNKAKAAHVSKHSYAADITFRETLDVVRDLTSVVFT